MSPGSVYSEDNYPVEFSFPATRHQTIEWGQVFTPERNCCLQGTGTRETSPLELTQLWSQLSGCPCGPPRGITAHIQLGAPKLVKEIPSKMKLKTENSISVWNLVVPGTRLITVIFSRWWQGRHLAICLQSLGNRALLREGGGRALCRATAILPSRVALPVTADRHVTREKRMG